MKGKTALVATYSSLIPRPFSPISLFATPPDIQGIGRPGTSLVLKDRLKMAARLSDIVSVQLFN